MSTTEEILKRVGDVIASEHARKLICGEYTDGSPRSLIDAINGEYKSPKSKKHENEKKRRKASLTGTWNVDKKKKKNKKKKNRKKEHGPLDKYILF
nr:MAG TPA: Protein of unknown function (DUF1387) [Caudoviricetes sp.]